MPAGFAASSSHHDASGGVDPSQGVRRLGFGVTGRHGSRLTKPAQTITAIERATELGVALFDVSPTCGEGEAERRLGRAMQGCARYDWILSSRLGDPTGNPFERERAFTPESARKSIDASLSRLGVTRIDWLFLEGARRIEMTDALMATLADFKSAGLIGALGYCGRGEDLDAAMATRQFALAMTPVNAALQLGDLDRLRRLRSTGAQIVAVEAMACARRQAPLEAVRRKLSGATDPARGRRMTPANAIRWALTEGRAHSVLTTTTRLDHLEQNVIAAGTLST